MPLYHMFLLDDQYHILGACQRECPEGEVALVVRHILGEEVPEAAHVEVWHGGQRVQLIRRG